MGGGGPLDRLSPVVTPQMEEEDKERGNKEEDKGKVYSQVAIRVM